MVVLVLGGIVLLIQTVHYGSINTPSRMHDAGYRIHCDEHFLQPPIKCRIVDGLSGEVVSNKRILEEMIPHIFECWYETVNGHVLPCSMD